MQLKQYGKNIVIEKPDGGVKTDKIPPAVYRAKVVEKELVLNYVSDVFSLPEKIYGTDHETLAHLVGQTMQHKVDGPTAVMLLGMKGGGKSITNRYVANEVIAVSKLPVAIIEDALTPATYHLLDQINGGCVFFIDEFAKKYSNPSERVDADDSNLATCLLETLTDPALSKSLFLMADNGSRDISPFMLDRPGRVEFLMKYTKLEPAIIDGLLEGIEEPAYTYLKQYSTYSDGVSFDVFKRVTDLFRAEPYEVAIDHLRFINVPEFKLCYPVIRGTEAEIAHFKATHKVEFDTDKHELLIIDGNFPVRLQRRNGSYKIKLDDDLSVLVEWSETSLLDDPCIIDDVGDKAVTSHGNNISLAQRFALARRGEL